MEDKEVQNEYPARIGEPFPGVIEDATHVDRETKRLYRVNGQFADFWFNTDNTWRGSALTAQELDNKASFTLI